jgi:hypothetical protein
MIIIMIKNTGFMPANMRKDIRFCNFGRIPWKFRVSKEYLLLCAVFLFSDLPWQISNTAIWLWLQPLWFWVRSLILQKSAICGWRRSVSAHCHIFCPMPSSAHWKCSGFMSWECFLSIISEKGTSLLMIQCGIIQSFANGFTASASYLIMRSERIWKLCA